MRKCYIVCLSITNNIKKQTLGYNNNNVLDRVAKQRRWRMERCVLSCCRSQRCQNKSPTSNTILHNIRFRNNTQDAGTYVFV